MSLRARNKIRAPRRVGFHTYLHLLDPLFGKQILINVDDQSGASYSIKDITSVLQVLHANCNDLSWKWTCHVPHSLYNIRFAREHCFAILFCLSHYNIYN